MNISISHIHQEIVSGETIASRPIMQQLLSEVEENLWSGVLVVEIERLARGDTVDQGIVAKCFKYSDTQIITPIKTYDPNNEFDEEYFEFGLFMSRREYKTINRRLQQGRLQSVKEGKYLGNIAPYGYKRIKLQGEKGYTLTPTEYEAKVVRLIYELYTKGDTVQETHQYHHDHFGPTLIASKLDELCIPPLKSNQWNPSTIRDILTNPVYIGKIRWKSRPQVKRMVHGQIKTSRPRGDIDEILITDGLHPPLISDEMFNTAQSIMKRHGNLPVKQNRVLKNPFAGIMYCGLCGHKMVRRPYKDGTATLICPLSSCNNVSADIDLVENRLISALEKWYSHITISISHKEQSSSNITDELELARHSISQINDSLILNQRQLDNLHNLLEQDIYTYEMFLDRSKTLTDRKNELNSRLAKLQNVENSLLTQTNIPTPTSSNPTSIMNIIDLYRSLHSSQDKNRFLKEFISKITYVKTVKGRWNNREDEFELVVYVKNSPQALAEISNLDL